MLTLFIGLILLPHYLRYQHQDFMIFLIINVLVVVSYRLMTLTGEWSLIHIVMMGVGAYTSALMSKHMGVSVWLTIPLAGLSAAVLAGLLSTPLFRMTQFYFLIGSFAVGEAIRLAWIFFIKPFGGSSGISSVPSPELLGIDFMDPIPYYYLVLIVVSLCLWVLYRIEKSRIGLTLNAVHWKAPLAQSVGVNTWKYRTLAFMVASLFVGIAGALKIHYLGNVTPHQFGVGSMVFVLIWVIVGGYNTFYGPIIGAVVLSVLDESLRNLNEYRPAIYGVLLIISIMFMPKGLEHISQGLKDWIKTAKSSS
ncbi:MAG: branched-chain amino acid ABC transporter permease [Gammaproteobacteria bacterium]|nr:branched-chain amino acid ABC transporter permease [Gammaproteobacteria bacterium]MCP4879285.1 branched-chain amino acid ABC transporter permease [Gammaproteobacteria bacterium]